MQLRLAPPVLTAIALGGFVAATLLLGLGASNGTEAGDALTASVPWLAWTVIGGLSVVAFVVLLVRGVDLVRKRDAWGLRASRARVLSYAAVAAVLLLLTGIFITQLSPGEGPDLPIQSLKERVTVLLVVGGAMAVPWLALVWLAHDECRRLRDEIDGRSPQPQPVEDDGTERGPVARLLLLSKLLLACVTGFAVAVIAVIMTSGALRGAFLEAHPDRAAEFSPEDVLLYGALFAVILALIAIPLLVAWRSCAFALVNRMHPLPTDEQPTENWMSARARLEKLMHLDVSILRNPVTALSIFAPLITATLAAFIPQLGAGN